MKILLAVDGSPFTKKMLTYLATHDATLGDSMDYTALTVSPELPARARAALGKATVDKYYADESDKILNPVVKFLGKHGLEVKTVRKIGHAADTIAKVAESGKFDLIIMGTQGVSALNKLVMGSVSTKVLAACSVPVLLIR